MPEITLFGWFHTLVAIAALLAGFYAIARYKVIGWDQLSGKIYLICTIIAAASALGIYKHGGFGIAHFLAVLTLFAVLVGSSSLLCMHPFFPCTSDRAAPLPANKKDNSFIAEPVNTGGMKANPPPRGD